MKVRLLWAFALAVACASASGQGHPANVCDAPRVAPISAASLHGNGVEDDTAAIQARLDSGEKCVCLPPPKKEYLISKTLLIGSDQELRLDKATRIRLAPWSNVPMVANRDPKTGNRRIAITGGIWDCDNMSQRCNPSLWKLSKDPERNKPQYTDHAHRAERYIGLGMNFYNVEGMSLKGLTIRNPVMYAAKFCRVSHFTVEDIAFDFTTWNPAKANMDGIHLDGHCHHGVIRNIRGTTFDDEIALNANDGFCAQEEGPITDIEIDGLFADYSHSGVRILSASHEAPVRRVTIRNVRGNFYRYAVGLTRFFHERPGRGVIDDITIEDCQCGSAPWPEDLQPFLRARFCHMPMIFCDNGVDIGNLTVRRFYRVEKADPVPTIAVGGGTKIDRLTVRDCTQENHTDRPLVFLQNRGVIARKTLDNVAFRPVADAAKNILETERKIWTDKGHVTDLVRKGLPVNGYYPDADPREPPVRGRRVMCLGDSITHFGYCFYYLQLIENLRHFGSDVRYYNAGYSGGCASTGLDRLKLELERIRPDRAFVMFGMNDVRWTDYDTNVVFTAARRMAADKALKRYETDMPVLADRILSAGVGDLILLTPTPYDEYSTVLGARRRFVNEYGLRAAASVVRATARSRGLAVVDLNDALTEYCRQYPTRRLCGGDSVHPGKTGYLVMTSLILQSLGECAPVASVALDATGGVVRAENALVERVVATRENLAFAYTPCALPFPDCAEYREVREIDRSLLRFNREPLVVIGLAGGAWELRVDGSPLGRFSAADLAHGVNLAELDTPNRRLARRALEAAYRLRDFDVTRRDCACVRGSFERMGVDMNDKAALTKANAARLAKLKAASYKWYDGEKRNSELFLSRVGREAELKAEEERLYRDVAAVRPVSCRVELQCVKKDR